MYNQVPNSKWFFVCFRQSFAPKVTSMFKTGFNRHVHGQYNVVQHAINVPLASDRTFMH